MRAGEFGAWLGTMGQALQGERAADVPCDGCTACCTSAQFVHVAPDEVETLARIPAALKAPAPGLPEGHVVLGYDERGHCPLLADGACSIYEHRPRTCRTYDCRIFAATGLSSGATAVDERAGQWRFAYERSDERARHEALRAAAAFVYERRRELVEDGRPLTAAEAAVLAVELHPLFLRPGASGALSVVRPDPETVLRELARLCRRC